MIICDDIHHCRTIPGIILSCGSTVFLCTWVALHPNVPKYPYEAWWKIFTFKENPFLAKRIGVALVALLAPEVILTIAFIQWVNSSIILVDILGELFRGIMLTMRFSRYLSERHPDCKWTETHAQLLNMGGVQIVKEDGTLSILEKSQLESVTLSHPHILKIPVEEIEDKTKGDFIAKMLVVVQTLWFALQVINRAIQALSVTELELTTLGHTVLNIFMYWCWWRKPVNIRFPFKVYPIEEKIEDRSERTKSKRHVDASEESRLQNPIEYLHGNDFPYESD